MAMMIVVASASPPEADDTRSHHTTSSRSRRDLADDTTTTTVDQDNSSSTVILQELTAIQQQAQYAETDQNNNHNNNISNNINNNNNGNITAKIDTILDELMRWQIPDISSLLLPEQDGDSAATTGIIEPMLFAASCDQICSVLWYEDNYASAFTRKKVVQCRKFSSGLTPIVFEANECEADGQRCSRVLETVST